MDDVLKYVTDTNEESGILKSLTFAVAMSFHSILEGFALGVQVLLKSFHRATKQVLVLLQDSNSGIRTLFVSLIIHKGIEAFSVGLQIRKSNMTRLRPVVLIITTYALMTPIGSMLGVIIQNCSMDDRIREVTVIVLEVGDWKK
jgi:zinc transporter ZupT